MGAPIKQKELPKNKEQLDKELAEAFNGVAMEDLAATFFNRYGHGLHNFLNSLSHKEIRRVMVNAFGLRDPNYNPKTDSNEGKFDWITQKLVEAKTAMYMNLLNSQVDKLKDQFDKEDKLEDKLISQEIEKQPNVEEIKELTNASVEAKTQEN